MPQTAQIIPFYLHPHVHTVINDNTVFTEEVASPPVGTRAIQIFVSDRGRDNTLLAFKDINSYIDEYGPPNFKLHGQPPYNAYAMLSTGEATVWCMRVMPDDAKYANAVICAEVSTVQETFNWRHPNGTIIPYTNYNRLVIQHHLISFKDLVTPSGKLADAFEEFKRRVELLKSSTFFPLYGVMMQGKGNYGNSFRIQVTGEIQSSRLYQFKHHLFNIIDTHNGPRSVERFGASLIEEGTTVNFVDHYADTCINDIKRGSKKFSFVSCPENITEIYEELFKPVWEANHPTESWDEKINIINGIKESKLLLFDPLLGLDLFGRINPDIKIDDPGTDPRDDTDPFFTRIVGIAPDTLEGIPLLNGEDGSLDPMHEYNTDVGSIYYDPDYRRKKINEMYIKAWNGELDRKVRSKFHAPAELILDANYDDDPQLGLVKTAMLTCHLARNDTYMYRDLGLLNNLEEVYAALDMIDEQYDRSWSKEIHNYKIKDPFTGRNMPVTIPYFYARKLPTHIANYGTRIPFAGKEYALLSGHVQGSFKPIIDADDSEIKEIIYADYRANYFEGIAENTYIRGTQTTSQKLWSDLSEENNMRILLTIKRRVENKVAELRYQFAEPEDRRRFTEMVDRIIKEYSMDIRSGAVHFDMNEWEEIRSILHCYVAIVFKTLVKRAIVEIDINPRNASLLTI